jgi:hypothetical protein
MTENSRWNLDNNSLGKNIVTKFKEGFSILGGPLIFPLMNQKLIRKFLFKKSH